MSEYSTFRAQKDAKIDIADQETDMKVQMLTSYRPHRLRLLSPNQKDDVPLARVDIVVVEKEDLIDTIFLQSTEFDE